jgi:hypothetical protein
MRSFQVSLPGLTRQSIIFARRLIAKRMDPRVKSAFTRVFAALLPAGDGLHKKRKAGP